MKKLRNYFKNTQPKATPAPAAPVPRAMDEIQKVYKELCTRLGEIHYKNYIDQEQIKQLNEALRNTNYEAAARQKLDTEAEALKKAEQTPEAEVKNV